MASPSPPGRDAASVTWRGRSTSRSPSWGPDGLAPDDDSAAQCAQWGLQLLAKLQECRSEHEREVNTLCSKMEHLSTERNQAVQRYKDITDKLNAASAANLFLDNRVQELEAALREKDDENAVLKDQLYKLSARLTARERDRRYGWLESPCTPATPHTPRAGSPGFPATPSGDSACAPTETTDACVQASPQHRARTVQCDIITSDHAEQLLRFVDAHDGCVPDAVHSGVCTSCELFTLTRLVCQDCYTASDVLQTLCDEQKATIKRMRRQLEDEAAYCPSPQAFATPSSVASFDKITALPHVRCSPGLLGLQHLTLADEMKFLDSHDELMKAEVEARAAAARDEDASRTAIREACFASAFDVAKHDMRGFLAVQEAAARRSIEEEDGVARQVLQASRLAVHTATTTLAAEHRAERVRLEAAWAAAAHAVAAKQTTTLLAEEAAARAELARDCEVALEVAAEATRAVVAAQVHCDSVAAAEREATRRGVRETQRAMAVQFTTHIDVLAKEMSAGVQREESRGRLLLERERDAWLNTLATCAQEVSSTHTLCHADAAVVVRKFKTAVATMFAKSTSMLLGEEARARTLIMQQNDAVRRDVAGTRVEMRRLIAAATQTRRATATSAVRSSGVSYGRSSTSTVGATSAVAAGGRSTSTGRSAVTAGFRAATHGVAAARRSSVTQQHHVNHQRVVEAREKENKENAGTAQVRSTSTSATASAANTPRGAQSRVREVFLQKARDRLALKLEKKKLEEMQVRTGARRSLSSTDASSVASTASASSVTMTAARAAASMTTIVSSTPQHASGVSTPHQHHHVPGQWVESPTKAVAAAEAAFAAASADDQLLQACKKVSQAQARSTSPVMGQRKSLSNLPLNLPLGGGEKKRSLSVASTRSGTPAGMMTPSARSASHYPPQTPCSHWAYGYDVGDQWIQLRETVLKVSASMALKISEIQDSKDKEGLFKVAHQSLKAILSRSISRDLRPGESWNLRPDEIDRLPRTSRTPVLRALRDIVCAYDMMRETQKESLLTVREINMNISSLILLARWSQQTSAMFRTRSSSPPPSAMGGGSGVPLANPGSTTAAERSSSCGIGRHSIYVVSTGAPGSTNHPCNISATSI